MNIEEAAESFALRLMIGRLIAGRALNAVDYKKWLDEELSKLCAIVDSTEAHSNVPGYAESMISETKKIIRDVFDLAMIQTATQEGVQLTLSRSFSLEAPIQRPTDDE